MSKSYDWFKEGLKIDGAEWNRRIRQLPPGPVQVKVASIVSWDFFGERPADKRWTHLDDLVLQWDKKTDPEPQRVVIALMLIGYPADVAQHRMYEVSRSSLMQDGAGLGTVRRDAGETSLFYAIAEQAVTDIRALRCKGVIVGTGEVRPHWPPPKTNGVVGYMNRRDVEALIEWVAGGALYAMCLELGLDLNVPKVMEALELEDRKVKVA
jgi:hypothetical protein